MGLIAHLVTVTSNTRTLQIITQRSSFERGSFAPFITPTTAAEDSINERVQSFK